MGQNRSSAVMQQRAEPHDSLDDFPTPPWATRALCEALQDPFLVQILGQNGADERARRAGKAIAPSTHSLTCREPAANRGHMVRPLREYFAAVEASDVHDYGAGFEVRDYLFGPAPDRVDWTITNPPFRLAEQFIARALETSRYGVAVIVRSAFLEGVGRWSNLFSATPPSLILQFSERVVMHRGKLSANGSTATAYCWLVWEQGRQPCHRPHFDWIPPCRKRLERKSDYEVVA